MGMSMGGDYPADWSEISCRIKEAADWRCERCGHADDALTAHVLTTHHLDGDKSNCEGWNLVALCQRCHLHVQATYAPGQLSLPLLAERWIEARVFRRRVAGCR